MMTSACQNLDSCSANITQLEWEKLPPIPDAEGFAGAFAGTHNGALIVAGGANIVGDKWGKDFKKVWHDSVFVLENPDAAWQTGYKLPRALGYGVSISTKDGIICIGGSDANSHYADVFRLAWQNGKINYTPLPALPMPCANFCGAKIGDTIYVAGGIENPNSTTALKTFWKLDLSAKDLQWEELEPWPGPGRMLSVAGECGGSFYLFSGAKLDPVDGKPVREYLRDAFRYTPGKGWERLADLPRAAVAAPSPAIAVGEELFLFTGDDGTKTDFQPISEHPGFSRETLVFNAEKKNWSTRDEVPFSRATAPVVEWLGNIVVANGESRPRQRTPEVWWAKPGSAKLPLCPDNEAAQQRRPTRSDNKAAQQSLSQKDVLLPLPMRNEWGDQGEGNFRTEHASSPRPSPPSDGGEGEIIGTLDVLRQSQNQRPTSKTSRE